MLDNRSSYMQRVTHTNITSNSIHMYVRKCYSREKHFTGQIRSHRLNILPVYGASMYTYVRTCQPLIMQKILSTYVSFVEHCKPVLHFSALPSPSLLRRVHDTSITPSVPPVLSTVSETVTGASPSDTVTILLPGAKPRVRK